MRLKKINYQIAHGFGVAKPVSGYAVDSPTNVRYCVRCNEKAEWVADHFDAGHAITNIRFTTWQECIDGTEAYLNKAIRDGSYARAIQRINSEAEA